ncbi:hypothetical protein ACQP3L_39960, partial [Escherichia coli]
HGIRKCAGKPRGLKDNMLKNKPHIEGSVSFCLSILARRKERKWLESRRVTIQGKSKRQQKRA